MTARGDREHEGQQPPRAAARAARHEPAQGLEEPLAPAAVGEHEQRGQEADRGAEVTERVTRVGDGERADGDEQHRAAHRRPGLDQPARVHDGCGQRAREDEQGEDEGQRLGHTGG